MRFLIKTLIIVSFLFPLSSFASVLILPSTDTVSNCASANVNDYSGVGTGYIADNYDCAHYPISNYLFVTPYDHSYLEVFDSTGACFTFADLYVFPTVSSPINLISGCSTNSFTLDSSYALADGTYLVQFQAWYWPHYIEQGFQIVNGKFYNVNEVPPVDTVISSSTSTSTSLTYSNAPSYLDWITVMSVIIFLLAIPAFSFIFQLFTKRSKTNTW